MCYLIFIAVKCYVKVCNSVTCFIAAKHTRVVDRVRSCNIYDLKVHFEWATSFVASNLYRYFTGRYKPIMPGKPSCPALGSSYCVMCMSWTSNIWFSSKRFKLFDQIWNVNQRSSSKLLTTRREERKREPSHLSGCRPRFVCRCAASSPPLSSLSRQAPSDLAMFSRSTTRPTLTPSAIIE